MLQTNLIDVNRNFQIPKLHPPIFFEIMIDDRLGFDRHANFQILTENAFMKNDLCGIEEFLLLTVRTVNAFTFLGEMFF